MAAYLVEANAAAAYRVAHPRCSEATSQTEGPATLRKPHVQAAIAEANRQAFIRQQMSGDQAMALIANIARGDIGDYLREGDWLKELPEDVRRRIKGVKEGKFGRVIELWDVPAALQFIAKATGKAKDAGVDITISLEQIVAKANEIKALPVEASV